MDIKKYLFQGYQNMKRKEERSKIAKELIIFDQNDDYYREIYLSNPTMNNVFYLYSQSDTSHIDDDILDESHFAITRINQNFLNDDIPLSLKIEIGFLAVLPNNKIKQYTDEAFYAPGFNKWKASINCIKQVAEKLFAFIEDYAQSILGKDRKAYYLLARYIYCYDLSENFSHKIFHYYQDNYGNYPALIREIIKKYQNH